MDLSLRLVVHASMGPSRVRDGDEDSAYYLRIRGELLQWGRRVFATETRQRLVPDSRVPAASMGPSRVRDGDLMSTRTSGLVSLPLQWGRRVFATETRRAAVESYAHRCFNGAVACSRRRRSASDTSRPTASCFNGAVACSRRRQIEEIISKAENAELQWGRRVFATETHCPESCINGRTVASMGPSRVRDGDRPLWSLYAVVPDASMGPSRVRDGDVWAVDAVKGVLVASMGPSRVRDGDNDYQLRQAAGMIASMGPSRVRDGDGARGAVGAAGPDALQWGRRVFATETWRGSRWSPRRGRRFNGAVACSRRRHRLRQREQIVIDRLQWGRRVFATETTQRGPTRAERERASMGPSRVRDGDGCWTRS